MVSILSVSVIWVLTVLITIANSPKASKKEGLAFAEGFCIAQGNEGAKIGMRAFASCEEALRKCPIMLFPDPPSFIFVSKGVKFPIRVVAIGSGGEILEDLVLLPQVGKVQVPSNSLLVVEIPLCLEGAK